MNGTSLQRRVEPEWLDELHARDARAVRCRRDLRVLNRIMGHGAILRRALAANVAPARRRIAELGAGDGSLLLRVLDAKHGGEIALVDREPAVEPVTEKLFRARGFQMRIDTADVFDWLDRQTQTYDAIVANLFLHHFETPRLTALLERVSRCTRLFLACEPCRARLPLAASRMLGVIGCNDVTRHDAVVSVRAGFCGRELSQCWPARGEWELVERGAGLFSHLFVARMSARVH